MKKLIYLVLLLGMFSCNKRIQKTEIIEDEDLSQQQIDSILTDFKFEYDRPIFIDSTSQVLLPIATRLLGKTRKWGGDSFSKRSYDNSTLYWNILFYNKTSGETRLLTESKLRISDYVVNLKETGQLLSKSILYKIRDTDYNKDKKLDYKDPEQLFISRIDGRGFKRLSPFNENLESYSLIPNSDQIMVKTRRDSNLDMEFNRDDEQIWYLIDLRTDNVKPVEIIDETKRKKIENLYFEQWLKKK